MFTKLFKKISLNTKISTLLLIVTLIVYLLSHKGEGAHWNYFVLLADAFINGRLYLIDNPPWLSELITWQNKYYVVYPPMPAILMLPFVFLFGANFYQPAFSILLGAINVGLCYLVVLKLFHKRNLAIWGSILFGFGTMHWFHAEVGSAWYLAHIVAIFFLWLFLLEVATKQRLFLIGLFVGFAYLARLPTILSLVFVLVFLRDKFIDGINYRKLNYRNLFILILGVSPGLIINGLYNFIRFGSFNDVGYSIYYAAEPEINKQLVFPYGFTSIYYIPERLKDIFFSFPQISNRPPYLIPSFEVMALYVVTPAFLLILFASFKNRLVYSSLLASIAILIPILMKGGNGFSQFGFRYALDLIPFLLIMTISGFKNKPNIYSKILIILSILVNLWGVLMISWLNLWKM